jgi:hypothetical protein
VDPSNGGVYTLTEFTAEYYGTAEWDTAGEALAARCEVERLYGKHEPAKLADVAALVAKYGAADLLCKVRAKYAAAEVAKEAKKLARRPSLAVSVVSDGPAAGGDAPAEGVFGLLPDDVLLMILTLLRPVGRGLALASHTIAPSNCCARVTPAGRSSSPRRARAVRRSAVSPSASASGSARRGRTLILHCHLRSL